MGEGWDGGALRRAKPPTSASLSSYCRELSRQGSLLCCRVVPFPCVHPQTLPIGTLTDPGLNGLKVPEVRVHLGDVPHPVSVLEDYFLNGGVSLIQATFANTYFIDADSVRNKAVYYPDRARRSRHHYPGLDKGRRAIWSGNGRTVTLDVNQRAQMAFERYTGRPLNRGIGYSVRHIWGHPWNPDAFTAGWNLCYMPYWAGMLTEDQHPHEQLKQATRQASWDLYFRCNSVCEPPEFVNDPGLDLDSLLDGLPLLTLQKNTRNKAHKPKANVSENQAFNRVKEIRKQAHQSWRNIHKAARSLQGLEYEPFGTSNVESSAKSCVRKITKETGLSLQDIEAIAGQQGR